ncbi:BMP family ABC transporter substrate-binding protein [Devosia sp. 63-57]|uniref:BMP family ABC transporter substrate-binding protein n=1 Tax=Devosia sp. 63-57 TaxID=1895751 RepID=UPI00086E0E9E|nr:MAG: BMP family ABC transporter substrate-binding protein [Pelagibacterium sp. SCN 63-126]ODU88946.1 MAG: BMP family ABC transporter substrate-binding protein [Pelagibacterium sp. SCN 63-17]OJX43157.1 MAG: BMP family ABC transporter substrate-binding protein [Devosia sp. 63-57]
MVKATNGTHARRALLGLVSAATLLVATQAGAMAQDKILLLINGALGDKSFFDSANRGLEQIKATYGDDVETRVLEIGDDPTGWEPALLEVSEQDWDLIIGGTFSLSETLGDVAELYPDNKYILFDASLPYDGGAYANVYSIQYKQNEGSYLGGILAASLLQNGLPDGTGKNLGFLGGMDIPVINDFLIGYIAGAQSVNPDIKVSVSYAGSFTDAAKGKELGLAQYRAGVGIGFIAASQAGLGQVSAAAETNQYVLGVDSDQEAIFAESDPALASRVVSSVLKNVDVSLVRAYEMYREGKLPFGTAETVGLAEGAVGIVETGNFEKLASPETVAAIEAAKAAIAAGEIQVPTAFGMDSAAIAATRDSVRP